LGGGRTLKVENLWEKESRGGLRDLTNLTYCCTMGKAGRGGKRPTFDPQEVGARKFKAMKWKSAPEIEQGMWKVTFEAPSE